MARLPLAPPPAASRARRPAALSIALLALSPAAAHAATVSLGGAPTLRVTYAAAAGERNQLELTRTGGGSGNDSSLNQPGPGPALAVGSPTTWTIRDSGAVITAGAGCTLADAHTASCSSTLSGSALGLPKLLLGDGDDTADLATASDTDGGTGNDAIRVVQDDGATSGSLAGGSGDDLLDASLGRSVELHGGSGGDLLTGSTQDDVLIGDSGSDELRGGQGKDELTGGSGADRFSRGPGNDRAAFDASDRLLDPDAPTLGLKGGVFARQAPVHDPTDDQANGSRTELRTDCENLGIPAAKARYRFDLQSPASITAATLVLGRRTSARRTGTLELRDPSNHVLGRASMATKVLRIQLTPLGAKTFEPGTRATVRIVTRPLGPRSSGTRGAGIEVDLSIAPTDA